MYRPLCAYANSVIAQACHASTAALWQHREEESVKEYLSDIDHMHKVCCVSKSLLRVLNLVWVASAGVL